MVTKAIIDSIINEYTVKVRIPFINKNNNNTSDAIICTLPQCQFLPVVGDVVLVAFEDYQISKPIIIGCLFKESGNTSLINITTQALTVESKAILSKDTTIGDITYDDLKELIAFKNSMNYNKEN